MKPHVLLFGAALASVVGVGCSSEAGPRSASGVRSSEADAVRFQSLMQEAIERFQVGDYGAVIARMDEAISLNSQEPRVFELRGRARQARGDAKGALADFRRVPDGEPSFVRAYVARGSVKLELGDASGAEADFKQAVGFGPNNATVFSALASAKRKAGNLEGAIADASRALDLDPVSSVAYSERGLAKKAKGDLSGALSDFDRWVEIAPQDTDAISNRGHLRLSMDDLKGARADFMQALALFPTTSSAWAGLGEIEEREGNAAAAEAAYRQAIQGEPARANPVRFHYTLWLRSQRLDERPAGLAGVMPAWPEGWPKTLGAFLLGEVDEDVLFARAAEGHERKVLEQSCEAYYYAGMVRLLRRDAVKAREYFEACLETQMYGVPEYRRARWELDRLGR